MKASKAPEKIYIDVNEDLGKVYAAFTEAEGNDIEYIRKDVFIEKACDAYCKVCGHFAHTVPTHICRHDCRYFSDFKKYMED